ncbi:hypothetical protein MFIFM68171_10721 [Madurella fahalii]|uniref:Uncharacterized protein n=1 Tax=Madurella fahalii TaxID=1157608 RepID=A0ABQ0GRZ5_9PEZI
MTPDGFDHQLIPGVLDVSDADSLFGGADDVTDLASISTAVTPVGSSPWTTCGPGPSWPLQPQLTLPQLSLPQRNLPVSALPAAPDPLGASFLSHPDGHTSGSLVVSNQFPGHGTPDTGPTQELSPDETTLDTVFEQEWELMIGNGHPVNPCTASQERQAAPEADFGGHDLLRAPNNQPGDAQTESQQRATEQDDSFIPPSRIPGFRYAKSQTNVHNRVRRRVDQNQQQAEELSRYVTLNRRINFNDLYNQLELGIPEGKRLRNKIKEQLKVPPFRGLVEQASSGSLETKLALIRASFYMLVFEGWGSDWFGIGCQTAQSRTLFWPTDSSILLVGFVSLLYKVLSNQKTAYAASTLRREPRPQSSGTDSTRSPSLPLPPMLPLGESSVTSPDTPDLANNQLHFTSLAKNTTTAKKRKHAESVMGVGRNEPVLEVKVPRNANLTYNVYVRDLADGSELTPGTTCRHVDMMERGAFSYLSSFFKAEGHTPAITIQTPFQLKEIENDEDWDHAVLSVYNVRRSGGVVVVDVWV